MLQDENFKIHWITQRPSLLCLRLKENAGEENVIKHFVWEPSFDELTIQKNTHIVHFVKSTFYL